MGIDNTTRRMQEDKSERLLLLAEGMMTGSPSSFIERQERDGQEQLVNSDRLPAKFNSGEQAEFEALGFTFGDPDPGDPLFRPATLPEGWKREGSDHAMWSYLLDQHGRKRVSIFYKAAWYDRDAFMNLQTLWSYAQDIAIEGAPVVLDDWATRDALLGAMRDHLTGDAKYEAQASARGDTKGAAYWGEQVAKYEAAIAALEAETEARA